MLESNMAALLEPHAADVCPSYAMCAYSYGEMDCARKSLRVIPCSTSAPANIIEL